MGNAIKRTIFGICTVTVAIYGCNQIIYKNAVHKELLNKNNGRYYKSKYGKMYYKVMGEGEPLLLIHDISCDSSGFEWENITKELSKKYKLYVIDLVGCGRSDKPNIEYTSYLYVQLISNFIKEVIEEKTSVVATGKSASIVTMVNKSEKDLIDKFIAISPEYIENSKYSKISIIDYLKKKIFSCPVFGTACYNFVVSKNLIEEKFEEELFFDNKKIRSSLINTYYESAHLGGGKAKYLYISLYDNYLYCNSLVAIDEFNENNYLMVLGQENECNRKIYKQYKNVNDDICATVVKNSKLLPQLEQPEEVIKIIDSFISLKK